MNQEAPGKINNNREVTIMDIVTLFKSAARYIKSKWLTILIVSILGGVLGLCYSIIKKPTYTAVCTFVLEDAKSGGIGQYAGLASLAGINIGGGGGGIFEGDNILELYKSRIMLESALLSEININGKNQKLIDRYVNFNHLRKKWKEKEGIDTIEFNGNPENFDRKQDSIITDFVELFNKKILDVDKPDKKLSIIDVKVTSTDELFSKAFTNKLVEKVNEFYILTKTKKANLNVQLLQHQADSVKSILNSSINGVASAIDAAPNANPLMSTLRVSSEKKQVDVQANIAVYSEIVKNLELAKISLRQEMPLIQVIDKPVLPLLVNKIGKLKAGLIGMLSGLFLFIGFLISKKIIQVLSI